MYSFYNRQFVPFGQHLPISPPLSSWQITCVCLLPNIGVSEYPLGPVYGSDDGTKANEASADPSGHKAVSGLQLGQGSASQLPACRSLLKIALLTAASWDCTKVSPSPT